MKLPLLLMAIIGCASTANALTMTPDWAASPRAEDVARVYPASARARGIEGVVVLDCAVTGAGSLADCRVVREGPANEGFGKAAVQLTKVFVLRGSPSKPERPTRMNLPIRFSLPSP